LCTSFLKYAKIAQKLLPETPTLGKIYTILEGTGWTDWMLVLVPGWGGRRVRQIGGEILPTHVYCNEKER
jgi:hypothetical protein